MEKWKIFEKHINMIENPSIKEFTKFALSHSPNYFWTMPATTSGRRHGDKESLIDHVQECLQLAECVIDQFKNHWTQRQNDQLLSALILHDVWRCNNEGEELRYTEEYVKENELPAELIGNLRTHPEHPEIGYRNIQSLAIEYNEYATENKLNKMGGKNLKAIADGVRYHYGPWTRTILPKRFSLSWPADYIVYQVHNIDYMQCQLSRIRKNDV